MGLSVFPTPSGATTSSYGIVGSANTSVTVTLPSGLYSYMADNSSGSLAIGEKTISATSGSVYLSSSVTSAVVSGLNKGITWSTSSLSSAGLTNSADTVQALTFGNGLFVGGSSNSFIIASTDGITWTSRTLLSSGAINAIEYGNGIYVGVNQGVTNNVQTSTDTITWTSRAAGVPAYPLDKLAYGNGIFVAAPDATTGAEKFATSTDGITWTSVTGVGNVSTYGLAFTNDIFIVGLASGVIRTSTDAVTWTTRTSNMANNVNDFAYGNGVYVAVGGGGNISSSTDGTTWTSRASNTTTTINTVIYGGGVFVAGGNGNTVRTSTDGITWTTRTGPMSAIAITEGAFGNGTYVLGGAVNYVGYAIGQKNWLLNRADSTSVAQ